MDDETLRAVQEQALQLTELEKHPGWAVYVDYLHTAMTGDKKAVLNGSIADIGRYHKITGRLQGIHFALDAPEHVRQMVLDEVGRRTARLEAEE